MYYLYRHFDSDNILLYVGISLSAINRLSQHKSNSAWFASIKRVEVQRFPTREDALVAERTAIVQEKPLYNIQLSTINGPRGKVFAKRPGVLLLACGELSLLQRKLANALLYHAYPLLPVQDRYEIGLSYLCDLVGFDSNDWKSLKEALIGLSSVVIEWDVREGDTTKIRGVFSMLADVRIDAKSGICRYAYDPFLREKFYSPEIYATINLDIQRKFCSKHALALYENCVRYRDVGSTGWMALEVFRQLIGCDEQPYYDEFKHLNCLVIKPAVQEVNETSDIEVTPEYKRQSRKIQSVRMKIKDKRGLPPLRAGQAKRKPAEDAARIAAMADEAAARGKAAKAKETAEKAIRDMKAILKRGGGGKAAGGA